MSISKVIKFFEQRNIYFTKTMLQNYVRVGVLPELENKRYYKKKHLMLLVLIDSLKNTYSLEELRILFTPFFNDDSNINYVSFLDIFNEIFNETLVNEKENLIKLQNKYNNHFGNTDYLNFILILSMMSKSAALKDIVVNSLN